MIIRCPQCRTGYSVNIDQIYKAGRTVRCSQCGHSWYQPKPLEDVQKPAPLAPKNQALEDELFVKSSKSYQQAQQLKRVGVGVFVSLVVVFSFLLLTQNFFEKTFPSMKGFYNFVGLESTQAQAPSSATGLVIPKNSIERTLEDGEPLVLTFRGKIVNTNSVSVTVPKVVVTLHDEKGVEIDRWPVYPEKTKLSPQEETKWVCRFFNPDLDSVAEHRVRFQ